MNGVTVRYEAVTKVPKNVIAIDVGHSANKSCGLAYSWIREAKKCSFCEAAETVATALNERVTSKTRCGLILEAPLSACYSDKGPVRRFEGEERNWWHNAGATVALAAIELLDRVASQLRTNTGPIPIVEAYAAFPGKHEKIAERILKAAQRPKFAQIQEGCAPISPLIDGVPKILVVPRPRESNK